MIFFFLLFFIIGFYISKFDSVQTPDRRQSPMKLKERVNFLKSNRSKLFNSSSPNPINLKTHLLFPPLFITQIIVFSQKRKEKEVSTHYQFRLFFCFPLFSARESCNFFLNLLFQYFSSSIILLLKLLDLVDCVFCSNFIIYRLVCLLILARFRSLFSTTSQDRLFLCFDYLKFYPFPIAKPHLGFPISREFNYGNSER